MQRVAGSGTYVSQRKQPGIIQDTLSLIIPSFTNPYYGELAFSIEREANSHGYQLLVGQSYYSCESEGSYLLRYAENPAVKGAIVVPCDHKVPMDAYGAVVRDTPLMFVSRFPAGQTLADSVICDRVMGGVSPCEAHDRIGTPSDRLRSRDPTAHGFAPHRLSARAAGCWNPHRPGVDGFRSRRGQKKPARWGLANSYGKASHSRRSLPGTTLPPSVSCVSLQRPACACRMMCHSAALTTVKPPPISSHRLQRSTTR